MASRNGRLSAFDRRQQIMGVAKHLFARQGFDGTTTREIARRARVNEAILFRHFSRKEDLYWAILDERCRAGGARQKLENLLASGAGDREVFASIAEDFLRRNTKDTTLGRLLLFSALEKHSLSHRFFRTHLAQYYEVVAGRIRQRIRRGEFRRVDPLLAARGFLGMVVYHFLVQELFGGKRYRKFDSGRVGRVLADIWLEGMHQR